MRTKVFTSKSAGVSAEPPEIITPVLVRAWYTAAGPNWVQQEERWFETLANACGKERDRHAMETRNASRIQESRQRWKALRQANDVVLAEMPPTIEELGTRTPGEPSELTAGRRRLLALLEASRAWHEAAKSAKPALDRIREPGGQPRRRVAFERRIAKHVLITWDQQGFLEWSLRAGGPFIGFLARLMDADSDENSRRFRLKPATCSEGSQPVIPTKPAGVAARTASGVNGVSLRWPRQV